MADAKISALSALDAFATGDLLPVVDDPGGTPATKKATIDQVGTFVRAEAATTELIQDVIGALLGDATGFDVTYDDGANTFVVSLNGLNVVAATGAAANTVGYIGAPHNIGLDSGNVTLALTDSGKHVYHSDGNTRTLTIPANASVAFPVGAVIAGVNENGAGVLTIAITSDTLRWGSSTGSRSVAANGSFTLLKVAATVWRLTGDGIT